MLKKTSLPTSIPLLLNSVRRLLSTFFTTSNMAAEQSVQLLTAWPSAFAIRAELALAFKNVSYDKIPQDLSNKSKLLLDSNPVYKKIPVLIDNGKPVPESMIIVQYVEEAWPSPDGNDLLPKDPYDKAVARFWADYVDKKLFDAMRSIVRTKGEAQKEAIELSMEALTTLEEALKTVPKEPPFFGGASIGYVDIILGPFAVWYRALETVGEFTFPLEEKFPCLHAWIKAFKASSIGPCLPSPEKLIEYAVRFVSRP